MARPPEPMYLERQTYRRRRLEDAARFLPWLGAVLLIFPALWADGGPADAPGTAARGLYIFTAWAVLVLVAALLSRRLMRQDRSGGPKEEDAG